MKPEDELPKIWVGSPESPQPNWRDMEDDEDADDEELEETPAFVIATLGFDPKGANYDDLDEAEDDPA